MFGLVEKMNLELFAFLVVTWRTYVLRRSEVNFEVAFTLIGFTKVDRGISFF